MPSGSAKRSSAAANRALPVPPTRRAQGKRAGKLSTLSADSASNKESALSPAFRRAPKAENVEMADADILRHDSMEKRVEEVVELTSSEEAGEARIDSLPSSAVNFRKQHIGGSSSHVEKAIRTRASSGISKKRVLENAATFSDEEDILVIESPPKKTRRNVTKVILDETDPDCEDIFDSVNTNLQLGDAESLSMSPLKLNLSKTEDDGDQSDPFIDDDLLEPLAKKFNNKGKNKARYVSPVWDDELGDYDEQPANDDAEVRLDSEEVVAIAKAVKQSRRELLRQDAGASTATSATGRAQRVKLAAAKPFDLNSGYASTVIGGTSATGSPARKTFRDVFPQPPTTALMSTGPTLYEDTMKFRVSSLPTKCEVDNVTLRDALLADDYDSLPPLKFGSLKSWSTTAPANVATVNFSQWAVQCPDLDFLNACNAVRFARYKHFIGPSRISPLHVNILYTVQDFKRSTLQCNFRTAICLTPILSQDCFLISASTTGLRNKYISGHFHQLEWQRFEAFTCMVFNKPTMIAQIANQVISFGTMGPSKSDRDTFTSPSKHSGPRNYPRNPAILTSADSTSAGRNQGKSGTTSSFRSLLSYTDEVPIYDAREHPFNFASDLDNLSSVLPRYQEEIPPYSFVVVGYTLSHYEKEARPHLATNIQFAILFGCE